MTRWTTSEVILTQSLAERIMVITKFIHIALACQGLHNYATLTQIVMGLQSKYVSNLVKTWDGLSPGDMKKWQELQELVDARKNWAKIRNEMDRATVEPQGKGEGCIPFMGRALPHRADESRHFHVRPSTHHSKITRSGQNRF